MSICPSKDLHSVFVDGELPDQFRQEYLSHIETCPDCQNTVKKLQEMRQSFANDSKSINLSQKKIDAGYEKIEKMIKFKEITSKATPTFGFSQFMPMINRLVPAVAAALVIALFLPIGIKMAFSSNPKNSAAYSQDYISQIWSQNDILNAQNSLASNIIDAVFADNNQTSLIKSTENLRNINLENIISVNSSSNIYAPVEEIIGNSQSSFTNIYNSQQNLYNIAYSQFAGF